jgi:hypothetical protein
VVRESAEEIKIGPRAAQVLPQCLYKFGSPLILIVPVVQTRIEQ